MDRKFVLRPALLGLALLLLGTGPAAFAQNWEAPDTAMAESAPLGTGERLEGDFQTPIRLESLKANQDRKYQSQEATLEEQSTTTLVEGKLFKLVEDAFNRRDEQTFLRLYEFFLESFPTTRRRGLLEEYKQRFFFNEGLEVARLAGGLLELTYPEAQNLDQITRYFKELRQRGIKKVQVPILQFLGPKVYLFAKQRSNDGYYFENPVAPVVENLLGVLADLAHREELHLLVSFPLRNHPKLGVRPEYILDESWNPMQNRPTPNNKLDLLNPLGQVYLHELLEALLKVNIDGIVFQDDFTYDREEGLSPTALRRYKLMTGKSLDLTRSFIPVEDRRGGSIDMVTRYDFDDFIQWRTKEVKQLLWELTNKAKETKKDLELGLEIIPEMVLEEEVATKWYSTNLEILRDLPLDYYILKWRKFGARVESDQEPYMMALQKVRDNIPPEVRIFTQVPLSQDTKNIINLNMRIRLNHEVYDQHEGLVMAIGPATRLEGFDITGYPIQVSSDLAPPPAPGVVPSVPLAAPAAPTPPPAQ